MSSQSAEETAYNEIINMIIMHQYPPGSAVVESQIAEKLCMSRTPVRNALKRLISDGLLDCTLNKGCSVPNLSRRDLDYLFDFRTLVEPACAREAAINYTPAYKDEIDSLIEEENTCLRSKAGELHIINEKMHTLTVTISGNNYFLHSVKQVTWRCQLYLFFFDNFYMSKGSENTSYLENFKSPSQHARLFTAIKDKNPDEAEAVMKEHIASTYNMLTQNKWYPQ